MRRGSDSSNTPDHVPAHVLCCRLHLGDPHLSEPLDTNPGHKSYTFSMQTFCGFSTNMEAPANWNERKTDKQKTQSQAYRLDRSKKWIENNSTKRYKTKVRTCDGAYYTSRDQKCLQSQKWLLSAN